MAIQLKDIPNIRYRAELTDNVEITLNDYHNYFRTYKKSEESIEDNSFFSFFMGYDCVFPMDENPKKREETANYLSSITSKGTYLKVHFKYDFRFAAVNSEYYTEGEFQHIKNTIENALQGTNLFLCFMVSHFSQLAGKPLKAKPEHYHIIISKYDDMSEEDYNNDVSLFVARLKEEGVTISNYNYE